MRKNNGFELLEYNEQDNERTVIMLETSMVWEFSALQRIPALMSRVTLCHQKVLRRKDRLGSEWKINLFLTESMRKTVVP